VEWSDLNQLKKGEVKISKIKRCHIYITKSLKIDNNINFNTERIPKNFYVGSVHHDKVWGKKPK